MGKSSRNTLAAELNSPDKQEDSDETSIGRVGLQRHDAISGTDFSGLVVLDPRRRLAKTEAMSASRKSPRQKGARGDESSKLGEQIGAQLRSLYDDVLNQPVPDRFLELLNKLESDTISPTRSKAPGER